MITKEDKIQITNLLNNFITEMNQWEIYCGEVDADVSLNFEQKHQKQKEKVSLIFDKYCTKKERKYGLPNCIHYGLGPFYNYNPKEENIIKIEETENKNKSIVHTYNKGPFEGQIQYIVLKKKGSWLIDSKKRHNSWKEKWLVQSL